MRQLLYFLLIYFLCMNCSSDSYQKLEGVWQGNWFYEKYETRITLKINVSLLNKVSSVIDFPDFHRLNIPVENLSFKDDSISFEIPSIKGKFNGILEKSDSLISGTWRTGSFNIKSPVFLEYVSRDPEQFLDYMAPRINENNQRELSFKYKIPVQLQDGWETGTLNSTGIDTSKAYEMFKHVLNEKYINIHSFLIVKNNKLVLEEYFYGFHRDMKHKLASATKSVTSSLIGIALDKKYIKGLDEKLVTFFPNYSKYFDEDKSKITLHHMLSMSAGIKWDEWSMSYEDTLNSNYQMTTSKNTLEYVLKLPMEYKPGEKTVYNSGISLLLGQIIEIASGMPFKTFAKKYLFDPLDISDWEWSAYFDGRINTGGSLHLRPRDMAKIGYLFLKNGKYQNKQIISEDWVKISSKHHSSYSNGRNYGYHWWINRITLEGKEIRCYSAQGMGGQYIFIFPDLDMVIVSTAGNYDDIQLAYQQLEMIYRYILPAISQNVFLPINIK